MKRLLFIACWLITTISAIAQTSTLPSSMGTFTVFKESPVPVTIVMPSGYSISTPVIELWNDGEKLSDTTDVTVSGDTLKFTITKAQLVPLVRDAYMFLKLDGDYILGAIIKPTISVGVPSAQNRTISLPANLGVVRVSLIGDAAEALAAANRAKIYRDSTATLLDSAGSYVTTRPEFFGAYGDGSHDDNIAVADALALKKDVLLEGDYLTTSYFNKYSSRIFGPGRILKNITGGTQQLNSYADYARHIFGQEYLYHLTNKLRTRSAGSIIKFLLAGDSTTWGVGTTNDGSGVNATGTLQWYLSNMCAAHGIADITWINDAVSGSAANQWVTLKLASQLAQDPDVMFVRFGINDPTQGRDVDWFLGDLETGLQTMRASKDVGQMSIVLFTPNTVSDTPNGRDEKWFEQINGGIRALARKYQCVFFDTYAMWQDSRNGAAGKWLDDPLTSPSGRGIHPNDDFNAWITTPIFDLLFPLGIRVKLGAFQGIGNQSNSVRAALSTDLPNTFLAPITLNRAVTGWPLGGAAMTMNQKDGVWLQMNWPYTPTDSWKPMRYRYNSNTGTAWGPWLSAGVANPPSASYKPVNATISFPETEAHYTVLAADGFPVSGLVKTSRGGDGDVVQILNSTLSATNRAWVRSTYFNGSIYTWTPWKYLGVWAPTRTEKTVLASTSDTGYDTGVAVYEVLSSDGWPISGKLVVEKNAGGAVTQKLTSTTAANHIQYSRSTYYNGSVTVWTDWSIDGQIRGSATYDPPSISPGGYVVGTATLTGAIVGKIVKVAFSNVLTDGLIMTAQISATNTVKYQIVNITGSAIDPASGTLFFSMEQ